MTGDNVIPFREPATISADEPSEVEIAGWRERAAVDPEWAARQIWSLLHRALRAEAIARGDL